VLLGELNIFKVTAFDQKEASVVAELFEFFLGNNNFWITAELTFDFVERSLAKLADSLFYADIIACLAQLLLATSSLRKILSFFAQQAI